MWMCVCGVIICLKCLKLNNESQFSLEDDDCSQMFITQSSVNNVGFEKAESDEEVDSGLLSSTFLSVDQLDFKTPSVSVIGKAKQYSDISDDEYVFTNFPQR